MSGNVIKFHEPSYVSPTVGEAVFTAEKLYKDNPLVVYPNDFGEFRIHMSDFIPQPQTFEKNYVYKIISAKMNGDGYNINCMGGGGDSVDSVEVFVNGDLTIDTIKLNGKKVPIRLEHQLSIERKQNYIFMDNITGIEVSISTLSTIHDLKELYSYSSPVYSWTGRYKLEFNGEITKGRYRTLCMPDYSIYWTGPHEMPHWFVNKNNRLAIIDIQKNLDICITEVYPYKKNIEPSVAVKNSFESFLRLSMENNHLTEINKENYFKKMNNSIIINPQDMLGVDLSEIGIDHSSLRLAKVRPDAYYDVEVQLSGDDSIALNRGDEVCTILINTENGEADCVMRGKRVIN